jgi:hypothetical protein
MSGEMLLGDPALDPQDLEPLAELGELRRSFSETVGEQDVRDCFR